PPAQGGNPPVEIVAMLTRSAADWNRGDLPGFMSDYARDSLTSYVSGGHMQYGWQALYDRYQANYFAPGKARDSLAFEEIRGRAPKPDVVIVIRNGHIDAVGPVNEVRIPARARRISLVGKTVLPGLIDAHAHVERWAALRYLAWGVTTVRDLHSANDSAFTLR